MTYTAGQRNAVRDLESIALHGDALEIIELTAPVGQSKSLVAEISISFRGAQRTDEGIPIRQRERFRVHIPPDFPFAYPIVTVPHQRWAGRPHVQWTNQLCLYQAPETEWDPSDGMFGFVERLHAWVTKAAVDELDPIGMPLHPPVAYITDPSAPTVIPRTDTPRIGERPWIGFATVDAKSDRRIDISGWFKCGDFPIVPSVAVAVLLSCPTAFEFPTKVWDLIEMLEKHGVSRSDLINHIGRAASMNDEGAPLIVMIGTPMRGVRGSGIYHHHLVAWLTDEIIGLGSKYSLLQASANEDLREKGRKIEELVYEWAAGAKLNWCRVAENRQSVTVRRDQDSPVSWFRSKSVAVWGCGAIGSHAAEALARAGVSHLTLIDNGVVTPGLMVRQAFDDADVGDNKAEATKDRVLRVRPDLSVISIAKDLFEIPIESSGNFEGLDLIVDATASRRVAKYVERQWGRSSHARPPIAAMVLGHRADRAILSLAHRNHVGTTADVFRKAKLEVLRNGELSRFATDFWPSESPPLFQPEPGCSDPTFVGGQPEVTALVGSMLRKISVELNGHTERSASSHLFSLSADETVKNETADHDFYFRPDVRLHDANEGYDIRISGSAIADLRAWVNRAQRISGREVETGGHLFGERDDAAGVLWVTEVSGPPPDSVASPAGFICGFDGVRESAADREQFSAGSVKFMGMWHTHPGGPPKPSPKDERSMTSIVNDTSFGCPKSLMLIVGTDRRGGFRIAGSVHSRGGSLPRARKMKNRTTVHVPPVNELPPRRDVGLALSGGGSKAIAFHLGCLRALQDRGVLERLEVVSGVSGGSVLAAMYAYSNDRFDEFDRRVQRILSEGVQGKIAKRYLLSFRVAQSIGTCMIAGTFAAGVAALRISDLVILRPMGFGKSGLSLKINQMHPPFRRWVSRTHAFQDVLRSKIVGGARMTDDRRENIDVVINATELRTGSAFRFGSRESGTWRFGKLIDNEVEVARAVAASAAYPTLLPALDDFMKFEKRGAVSRQRVALADGGIYDNLGTSCLEPDRADEYSTNVYKPRYIISCDAGHGVSDPRATPYWWPTRVIKTAETMFRQVQNRLRSRLFDLKRSNQIDGFVLAYLGTEDGRIPAAPADLVPRDEFSAYPTDFAPMQKEDIDRLALRGEQITRQLITRYLPDL